MNNYNPYNKIYSAQGGQTLSYFPQPQGNVYLVNNSLEVANIPVSGSLSMILCPNENSMFLKTFQNGVPTILAYSILPYEQPAHTSTEEKVANSDLQEIKAQIAFLTEKLIQGGLLE